MNPPLASSAIFSLAPRVAPNAWHAFGGVWRLTVRRLLAPMHWLVLAGLLAALALVALGYLSAGNGPERYPQWFAEFYLLFLVPVMAFVSGAGAMRDDLKAGSADYLFTRPVRRPAYVAFRYLAHLACAQVDFLLAFGVMVGAGLFRHSPGVLAVAPWLLAAQAVLIAAFAAFGFLCGLLTSRYIVIGLFYGGVVEVGVGSIPTELNRLSMTRQMYAMLEPMFHATRAAHGGAAPGVLVTLALPLAFAVVMLGAAAAVFALRELAGAPAGES